MALPLAGATAPGTHDEVPLLQRGTGSLREALEAARYAIRPAGGNAYAAANPAQRLRAIFSPAGLGLSSPRGWRMGWRLRSAGYGERQTAVGPARLETGPDSETSRIYLRHEAGIDEWYVNRPDGLEQGFTLHGPPDDRLPGAPLRLTMDVQGDLHPRSEPGGQGLALATADDATVLRYADLRVTDASGRGLPAAMRVAAGPDGKSIWLEVEDAGAVWPVTVDPTFTQQAYLKASNTGAGDWFGFSVAASGTTVAVGAWNEDSSTAGINGASNDLAADAGAVYVFVRNGGVWSQQAYLKASNPGAGDNFGFSVALSGDTLVVGAVREDSNSTGVGGPDNDLALNAGAAYVFVRSGGVWSQQAYLKASNTGIGDFFGQSVAVSGDTVVVGSPFEDSSATGVNGASNESGSNAGAAYVFVRNGGVWSQQAYLKASNTGSGDAFGWSVGASQDTVIVGANLEDSSATGINGADNDLAPDSGAAYVFVRTGAVWSQQAYCKASNTEANDRFGQSVAVFAHRAVVGANFEDSDGVGISRETDNSAQNAGAAYAFARNGFGQWQQDGYLKAVNAGANDGFGISVAISGDRVLVGAAGEGGSATGVDGAENDLAIQSGAAYLFVYGGIDWTQTAYIKASNTGAGDAFGGSVALWGDLIVAGAPGEDSSATGVNANGGDNTLSEAGAAYVLSDGSCSYAFLPAPAQNFLASGGAGQLSFNTTPACFVPPTASAPWIAIGATAPSGALVWTTSYSAAPNLSPSIRSATIAVGSASITVTQAGSACSYGLTATSANVASPGAVLSVSVIATPGCPWIAAANAPWITVDPAQGSGFGNGSASYSVEANPGSAPRVGTLTVAGLTFTVSQAGNAGPPAIAGVSPASGTGASGVFAFSFTDPDGFADLHILNVLINNAIDGRNACYIAFVRPTNQLLLVNDAGQAGGPFAGATIPGTGTATNSQCTVSASGSSVSAGGNSLTLTLNIAFHPGFGGRRVIYTAARDVVGNNTGWHARGVWTVPFSPPPTAVVTMTPTRITSNTVLLTTIFSDQNGFADLNILNILINDGIDGRNACYLAFVRPSRTLFLVNDAGEAGGPFAGSIPIPGAGVAANSQCSIVAAGSSVVESGSTVTLTLNLTFSAAFQGDRLVFAAARDVAENNSGWQAMATITLP
ncbi:MAG: BACON domain-containing carbohydrate-binding protein [Bryobacteraceae bacterium]